MLVDAPCTGWGVLRRNPDAKWRDPKGFEAERERLAQIQMRLLSSYSALVKPGGILVYSLCTFSEAETFGVTERWSQNSEWESIGGGFWGPGPDAIGGDGFFAYAWKRRG
mgnify:FL=1